jgi:DNA mismatch endonuclease (patch repair protein)
MRSVKSRDTRPEIRVRKSLHKVGYRFRLHDKRLPGCPDIVFPGRRAIVNVNGCFWHQHPGCKGATLPKTNALWWQNKLARNVERDSQNERSLKDLGWRVFVVWECMTRSGELWRQLIVHLGAPPAQRVKGGCDAW